MLKRRGFFDRMGGRKFLMAAAALVMAFVLALMKALTGEFTIIAGICVGAFTAGDAIVTHKAIDKGVSLPSSPRVKE